MGNPEAAIDRLSHCQDKLHCLYCLNFQDLGNMTGGGTGLAFILRDIANDLKEIEEELLAEKRGITTQGEPPKV